MKVFTWKGMSSDIVAGFSVFVLALPLCLGIAMASNFPAIAGILAAICGGLIASFFGGAQLSIKGPAAGLIVIALAAVSQLGQGDVILGYKRALAVGVVAAIIQIVIAVTRKASIAQVMPPSVIHGMLAAIGVIIIAKQLYVFIGVPPAPGGPLQLLYNIPFAIIHENPVIFGIGLISFVITASWPYFKKLHVIPSSIVVLAVVIPLSLVFDISHPHSYHFFNHSYNLSSDQLIHLPSNVLHALSFPDFSAITSWTSIKFIIMFSLVGSIESLLTVCAVDSIAPEKAPSDLNRDLLAVGVGNFFSALIGGLPMISEIVRSKANIEYGAKSAKSNFFHGLFMLIAILVLPGIMNLIPLSALAALLIYVGLKLASPKEFIHAYRIGWDQFLLFAVTFLTTLAVDLLTGVIVGVVLKIILHLFRISPRREIFSTKIRREKAENNVVTLQINGALTFMNYLNVKSALQRELDDDCVELIIDLSDTSYIDHTVTTKLANLSNEFKNCVITIKKSTS